MALSGCVQPHQTDIHHWITTDKRQLFPREGTTAETRPSLQRNRHSTKAVASILVLVKYAEVEIDIRCRGGSGCSSELT